MRTIKAIGSSQAEPNVLIHEQEIPKDVEDADITQRLEEAIKERLKELCGQEGLDSLPDIVEIFINENLVRTIEINKSAPLPDSEPHL